MTTIYIDVLFTLNLILTWAMAVCAGILTNTSAGRLRLALGSMLGGAGSLTLLLPDMPSAALFAIKFIMAGTIAAVVFGWKGTEKFLRQTSALFLSGILIAGIFTAISSVFGLSGIIVRGGAVYFHVSALLLAAAALAGCAAARLLSRILGSRVPKELKERFTISVYGRETEAVLLTDTGNRLSSFGKPVAVIKAESAGGLVPGEILDCAENIEAAGMVSGSWKGRLRLVPCKTAAGEKLLPGVRATLIRRSDGERFCCILAIAGKEAGFDDADGVTGILG